MAPLTSLCFTRAYGENLKVQGPKGLNVDEACKNNLLFITAENFYTIISIILLGKYRKTLCHKGVEQSNQFVIPLTFWSFADFWKETWSWNFETGANQREKEKENNATKERLEYQSNSGRSRQF